MAGGSAPETLVNTYQSRRSYNPKTDFVMHATEKVSDLPRNT
jgi:hypothetical protein